MRKYQIITKLCPVCFKPFETLKDNPREKTTCSHSCSNTYFRSGSNNPNYKEIPTGEQAYVRICFRVHEKRCIACGENRIVEVHHIDGNHSNNSIENLAPLCPTHHQYMHSRHRHLVEPIVQEFQKKFLLMLVQGPQQDRP